jgi:hypothetical protein
MKSSSLLRSLTTLLCLAVAPFALLAEDAAPEAHEGDRLSER